MDIKVAPAENEALELALHGISEENKHNLEQSIRIWEKYKSYLEEAKLHRLENNRGQKELISNKGLYLWNRCKGIRD